MPEPRGNLTIRPGMMSDVPISGFMSETASAVSPRRKRVEETES